MTDAGDAEGRAGRILRLVAQAAVVVLAAVATTELLVTLLDPATLAAAAALLAVPVVALVATARRWTPWARVFSPLCWIAGGVAVVLATSCRPLSRVEGMQTGGLAVVAIVMLAVPVLRGGYQVHGLGEIRGLGPMVDRIDRDRR